MFKVKGLETSVKLTEQRIEPVSKIIDTTVKLDK